MALDHKNASVSPDQYTAKDGNLVKTWALKGLTGWKTVSIRQGDEPEACKILESWLAQLKRVAALRIQLDEAQTRVNLAKKSRDAFLVIYAKYPGKLEAEKSAEDKAVAEAESNLAKLVGSITG